MDKEQIKKEIEKRLDKWGFILFFNATILLSSAILTLIDMIPLKIGLIIILISIIINLFGFLNFSTYAYDIIEERYDEFLKREEYSKTTPLKDKILDLLLIIWLIFPIIIILAISIISENPLIAYLVFIIWLIIPYFFKYKTDKKE